MKRVISTFLIVFGMILIPAGNANAEWKPTLTPLTAEVQDMAFQTQLLDCYQYRIGQRVYASTAYPTKNRLAFRVYYRARCNPNDQFAKAISLRGKVYRQAYRIGLREGWCFRWLGNSDIGTPVSTTCVQTVQESFYR